MQVQLICYKLIFVNLDLRQTYKRLDKTFIKKKKNQADQPNSTRGRTF